MSQGQASNIFIADYSPEEVKKAHDVLYNEGLRMRIKVAGEDYVQKSLQANKDPFSKPMQEVSQESLPKSMESNRLTSSIVRRRSLLGLGMDPSRPGAENAIFPQYCHVVPGKPSHRASNARKRCPRKRSNGRGNTRSDSACDRVLWDACGYRRLPSSHAGDQTVQRGPGTERTPCGAVVRYRHRLEDEYGGYVKDKGGLGGCTNLPDRVRQWWLALVLKSLFSRIICQEFEILRAVPVDAVSSSTGSSPSP